MGFSVVMGNDLTFGPPSWRPHDHSRGVVEISEVGGLTHSRANLWRYPPGAHGFRHVQLAQEEVFVVLDGTLTIELGDPPAQHNLPAQSVAAVEPNTPLKVMNNSGADVTFFVYGAPADPSAEIVEDAEAQV